MSHPRQDATALAQTLREGTLSVQEVVHSCLNRIHQSDAELGAFLELEEEAQKSVPRHRLRSLLQQTLLSYVRSNLERHDCMP